MGRILAAAIMGSLLLGMGAPAIGRAPARAASFGPVADSFVDAAAPSSNYGTRTYLRVDASPLRVAYLRFVVEGAGTDPSARLRLRFVDASEYGVDIHTVADNGWGETTITAANAPALGPVIDSVSRVLPGETHDLDVSSAIKGDGPVSFAITTSDPTAFEIDSRESANPPQLLVPAPPSDSPFLVTRDGSTYQARSETTGLTFTGTLKSAVESAMQHLTLRGEPGTIRFSAGTFDLGTENFSRNHIADITFEGAGIDQTIIQNQTSVSADTEPFDFEEVQRIVIRDMTIAARGSARATSDAIDFDAGNDTLVERVKITAARGRGIVYDGKGTGWTADRNVVRDCVITGVFSDGIEMLASSDNRVERCSISDVGGHGIQITKSSPSARQPNKKSNGNVVTGNLVVEAGLDGVNVSSSDGNRITANTIRNSSDETSGRDGIRIHSDDSITCDDNLVEGNASTDDQAVATQRYGLRIDSSLCHRTVVRGNDLTGNGVGEMLDLGTDTIIETPADSGPPSIPTEVTATAVSFDRVDVSWAPSTDDVGVTGYTVYRDGTVLTTVGPASTGFTDTTVIAQTTYSYTVDAFDAAGDHSLQSSPPASATTPDGPTITTLEPVADAYVDAGSPSTNRGTLTSLRVDASPDVRSYVRFDLASVEGTVTQATLRLFANSGSSVGHDVRAVAGAWTESMITYANAPPVGPVVASSGPFTSGAYRDVDVTPLATGSGTVTFGITTTSGTAISYGSRESSLRPLLVIHSTGDADPDLDAPSTPTGLSATAVSHDRVELAWTASTDDRGVAGYTVYRDGTALTTVGPASTEFTDTTVIAQTTYAYTIDAFDAAGNRSAQSASAMATTPAGPGLVTLEPDADAYVDAASPSTNRGELASLRADASPDVRSYLRFEVTGIGSVAQATLRLFANSGSGVGHGVSAVADTSWGETAITYANAPAIGPVIGSSGPFTSGAYRDVDVTSLVTGNGALALAVTTPGSTAISYGSRESSHPPLLVISTGGEAEPDVEPPSAPTGLSATALSHDRVDLAWTASGDDVGVTGYTVYRDGLDLATVSGSATTFQDASALPETTYAYTVDAFDAAGHHSAQSDPAIVTTPAGPSTFALEPVADAYVDASAPDTNRGELTSLRVDGSPEVRSYLRFDLSGLTGTITGATLRLFANSSSSVGHDVRGVLPTTWTESTITYANAPELGAVAGSSGPFSSGGYRDVDVTSLLTGSTELSIAVTTTSGTAVSFGSRESANPPQLVITISGP